MNKNMSDREILEKYIDLESSCLAGKERKEVMDMLYKYKEVFSLRNEIDTCPNIEVEIDVTDKSPFLIRPYHAKGEDKNFIDKEIFCLKIRSVLKNHFIIFIVSNTLRFLISR